MVEQRIENPCVTGSSPVRGTKIRGRGRAVECTGLENRRWGNLVVSSNLTVPAKFKERSYNGIRADC